MAVSRIKRKTYIFIYAAALRTVPILPADHGTLHRHNGNAALVASGVPAIGIQRPGSFRLIESAVGIVRFHGIAVLGADAVSLHHQLIAAAFPNIKGIQRVCHLPVLPCRRFLCGMRPRSLAERHEHRLVIVAGERCRFVILNDRAFPAALAAGTDFQRLGCFQFHHERLVVAAHSIIGADCRRSFQRPRVSGILAVVFIAYRSRNRPGTERGRGFLPIPDPTRLCGMLRAETGRLQNTRRMVRLRPESAGNLIRHIHPLPALVV